MSYSEKLSLWAIIPLRQHRRTWHMIAPCPYVCLQTRQMYNYNLKTDKLLQAHNIRYIIESWAVTSLHPSSIIQPTLAMERGVVWVQLLRGAGTPSEGADREGASAKLAKCHGNLKGFRSGKKHEEVLSFLYEYFLLLSFCSFCPAYSLSRRGRTVAWNLLLPLSLRAS